MVTLVDGYWLMSGLGSSDGESGFKIVNKCYSGSMRSAHFGV